MKSYYSTATTETIDTFLTHSLFDGSNTIPKENFDQSIKNKIYSVSNSGILNRDIDIIVTSVHDMGIEIDITSERRIKLPNDKVKLKALLRFLDDDF